MLALMPAPAVRVEIESQPTVTVNGDVGGNNPNVSSSAGVNAPASSVVTAGETEAVALVIPSVGDNWALASSSCNHASSSAVSWMYDAGGRGKSGGGVSGGVEVGVATCLWSREGVCSVRVGEGFPGDGVVLGDK
jgi:hypothetical protein